jgi:hypothetical protein
MVDLLEGNCLLTLFDLVDELHVKFGIEVAHQTVHSALDAICYMCKKTHAEPSEMNSSRVKDLRHQYVTEIMDKQAQRKKIVYFDETNSISPARATMAGVVGVLALWLCVQGPRARI